MSVGVLFDSCVHETLREKILYFRQILCLTHADLLRITKVNLNTLTTPHNSEYKTLAVLKMNYETGKDLLVLKFI